MPRREALLPRPIDRLDQLLVVPRHFLVDGLLENPPDVRIENIEITPGETVNIQVNPGADSTGAADEWYRMKVFIASFRVSGYDEGGYSCP